MSLMSLKWLAFVTNIQLKICLKLMLYMVLRGLLFKGIYGYRISRASNNQLKAALHGFFQKYAYCTILNQHLPPTALKSVTFLQIQLLPYTVSIPEYVSFAPNGFPSTRKAPTKQSNVCNIPPRLKFYLIGYLINSFDRCVGQIFLFTDDFSRSYDSKIGLSGGLIPGWEDPLEKGTSTHSSILAWRIPWTVQSMRQQRVGHD